MIGISVVGIRIFIYNLWGEEGRGPGTLGQLGLIQKYRFWFGVFRGGSEPLSVREMSDAEVCYFDVFSVLRPNEIGGLNISMNNTMVMD